MALKTKDTHTYTDKVTYVTVVVVSLKRPQREDGWNEESTEITILLLKVTTHSMGLGVPESHEDGVYTHTQCRWQHKHII